MGVEDTIVAVSTPAGYSMQAVIRLSGPRAVECAAQRFRPRDGGAGRLSRTFRATPGNFVLSGDGLFVPAVLYVMRAPRSYTREDVVEFHVPGSPALLDMILHDLVAHGHGGLSLAEPGEFTRRAFLNGRIDLSRAEAVLALIRARSESELLAATSKLSGSVGRRCAGLQEAVTDLRAQIEAALDFAPHGIDLIGEDEFMRRCDALRAEMAREIEKGRGEIASDGTVHVVICGPPNAGKSSLLNKLAGAEKAIVHAQAGTTRDAVSAEIEVGGIFFRLSDTAGLTEHAAGPDAEAVRRAREHICSCQLLLVVLDGSVPLPEEAVVAPRLLPAERVLCVINKCDLPQLLDEETLDARGFAWETLHTSALTGEGMDGVREALGRTVTEGRLDASASDCLFNARQRNAIARSLEEMGRAAGAVGAGLGYEFAALDLREAAEALGEVTGEVTSQDVLDRIFSQFCIGK